MCFGRRFRSRIQFFLSALLLRASLGLVWLVWVSVQGRGWGARHREHRVRLRWEACISDMELCAVSQEVAIHKNGFAAPVLGTMLQFDLLVVFSVLLSMLIVGTSINYYTELQVLQLKRLRLETSFPWPSSETQPFKDDAVSPVTLGMAIEYIEKDHALNQIVLLGIPMTTRAILSLVAGSLPLLSGIYYAYQRNL